MTWSEYLFAVVICIVCYFSGYSRRSIRIKCQEELISAIRLWQTKGYPIEVFLCAWKRYLLAENGMNQKEEKK